MKNLISIIMALILASGLSAQATRDDKPAPPDKPADYAIVDLAANHSGNGYECVVKYSDGKKFSLDKTLKMTVREGHLIDQDDIDEQEFKVLEYLNKLGFEFLSVSYVPNFLDTHYTVARERYPSLRLRFKRKGI